MIDGDARKEGDPVSLDRPISDGGDLAQEGFAYQYAYTYMLAIEMYAGRISCEEIICEYIDDVMAKNENGKYVEYQVKSRQNGMFSWNDQEIKKTISKFVRSEKRYGSNIEKFVIVTNVGIRGDLRVNKESLINYCEPGRKGTSPSVENFYNHMENKYGLSREEIVIVLRKTETIVIPGVEYIKSKIITDNLANLPEIRQQNLPIKVLEKIYMLLENRVRVASSKEVVHSFEDVKPFVKDYETKQHTKEMDSKTITKKFLEDIITRNIESVIAGPFCKIESKAQLHNYYRIDPNGILPLRESLIDQVKNKNRSGQK